ADERAVPRPQIAAGWLVRYQTALSHDGDARDKALGQIEIVGRNDDDRAVGRELPQPAGHDANRPIVQSREGLVHEHEARPMQPRMAADDWRSARSPYRISPLVGVTSVAIMPRRVDLPAPLGPSRPTISPLRAVSVTCETARRRTKCRETSASATAAKSAVT